jgi:RHS repeat-associated protein
MMRRTLMALFVCLWWTSAFAQQTDQVTYYHTDVVGSVRMVTTPTGTVWHDYLPFGEEWVPPAQTDKRLYAGKERDGESGFDYFGARYYASTSGRFTTVDPGHVNGDLSDPQSWNAYAYARNNPFRYADPDGTDYFLQVADGESFWTSDEDFERLKRSPGDGISLTRGVILASNKQVGTYRYFSPFDRTLIDAGRMADAGVRYSAGVVAQNFLGTGAAVGVRWGAEALVETLVAAAEVRAAQMAGAAANKRAIGGVLKQIAQGTTKGKVFGNFGGDLPTKAAGYYREYTVSGAGQVGRGAARLVTGAGGEVYYTADHYVTFVRLK